MTDGSITGFICNWAGPGSSHTLVDYAQYQAMSYDSASATVVSDSADIQYAPTTSCEYIYDGSVEFYHDTDADGDLTDEDATVDVENLLYKAVDVDGDAVVDSIKDNIADTGFLLPVM